MSLQKSQQKKLSKATIETLSIIVYHQPVTRSEIEEIRGVAFASNTLEILLELDWVKPAGRKNVPGKPIQYATTENFLNHFNIKNEKKIQISKAEAEEFYKVHQSKPFYSELCNYLSSGPIVVMILEKENAVLENRELMGATNPKDAEEGTIRKKYGISIDKNSVHGSDSVENAKIEIDFFFKD